MVRIYLGLAVVAIAVLILFWDSASPKAKVGRWTAFAYLVVAGLLLGFGIGL